MENFPQVVGKSVALMNELIEGLGKAGLGLWGKEKFCTNLNLPGLPGFGMIESGDDWNGPIRLKRVGVSKGPMYRNFRSSF
jgi:hypothetical protein